MPRSLPPLTWFRSFEAAGRHLSFTAAAAELGVTQSAVSQQVRSLELRLGVSLFLRRSRGLALTDDGRKLMPKVGASLAQLAAATAGFDTGSADGMLTVATSVSVARWIIAPRLNGFLADHPGQRIRLLGTIWPDEFHAALADVEVRFGSAAQVGQRAERLQPDDLIAVSRMAVAGSLCDQTLVETVGTSMGWSDWADLAGSAEALVPTVHVDSFGAALDLAAAGVGIALTSSLLAADALATGQVVQVGTTRLPCSEGYFLAIRDGSDVAGAFGRWLKDIIAQPRGVA